MNLNFYAGKKITKTTFVTRLSLTLLLCVVFFVNSFAQPAVGLAFDGSNDFVNVPNHPALNISNEITIEAWVNYSKTVGTQNVVCKSSAVVTNSYIFPRTEDGWRTLQFWINLNGQGPKSFTVPFGGSSNSKRNQWHHLAATYDGYYMRIYIDGVLAGSQAQAGNITVNSNDLTIGSQKDQLDEFFGGKLDDIRIWNRALSACEIANTMSCELNAAAQTGLAAYYKFNQGTPGATNTGLVTATDESANQNDGTLTNFDLTGATSNWAVGIASGTCAPFSPVTATAGAVATLLPVGSDIQFTASGGDTYSWTGPNGFTSNQQNPVIPAAGANRSGTYTVVVTKNGCSANASVTITVTDRAKALTFDGTDDLIRIPNAASFNSTTSISIEMWIKPTRATPLVQNVLTKSSFNQNNGYIFPRTDDGWQSFSFWLAVNGQWKVISAQFGNLNQWTHVAATYDGFFMKIYMNGNLVSTLSAPGSITVNSNDLQIGQQPGYSAEFYQGGVDEMRVWSRALTQCEIQNNQTCEINGANNGLAALSGLSAYYRFNQGLVNVDNSAYTTLIDSSANHNNGTLVNFTLNGTASNWTSGGNVNNATCTPFVPNDATASSNGPIVEVGQTLALQASAGSSWSWTGPLGFTSTQQNPTIPNATVDRSGTYTVTVTGNGCSATASTKVQVAYKAGTLNFDGVNDYAIVPANNSLNITKEITMEAWIYPTSTTRAIQDVMGKSRKGILENDNLNTGYIFPRTDDSWGSYVFYLHLNGVWQKLSAPYPGINQWHHVAATYDGYYMRIYLDGRLSASKLAEGSITVNSNDLYLGWQQGFDEYFQGKVDEARLWNRALNQCEIINNMNCELAPAARNGLVAYFQFNQGFVNADNSATSSIIDASGNSNNASLQNFALNGLTSNWSDFKVSGTCGVYTLPPVTATANGSIFGIGSTIKLFSTGGDTYSWDGPAGFTAAEQNPTIVNAQLNQSGVYTVTAPFVNCVVTASTRLSVSALSPIAASGPTTFCPSSSVTLSTPNSGTAYQWFRDGVAISGATSASYTANVSGNYTVSVTTGRDVLVSEPISVTVEDNLAPQPTLAQLPVLNLLTPATVTTFPTATDNCAGLITATTTSPLQYNDRGSFVIHWVYDDHNGHVVTQDQQVEVAIGRDVVPPVLTLPANIILPGNATTCGAVAAFNATATDNSGDPVTITYSQLPNTLFAIGVTTVHVTAADPTGNETSGDFTVTVTPTTVAPISGVLTVCAGEGSILSTPSAATGGTWSSSNPAVASVDQNGNVTGNAAGTATITFTNNCGASASTSFTVNAIPATPVVSVTDNCGSSFISTDAAGSLLWSNGQTVPSFTSPAAGLYSVTQTVNGCTSAAGSATAAPKAIPAAPVVVVSNNCGNSVLTATGQNLAWSNGSNASAITVADAATYTVTQTVNGCVSPAATVQSAPVAIPAAPSVTVTNNCADAILSTNATGTLSWSNGSTSSSITVSLAGSYSVTQTINGCTSPAATASAAPKGFPAAPVVSANNICGSSILTASGSNLQWSTGSSAASITVSNAADYQVTQTVNGCTSPAATVHASPLAVPATPVVTVQNNCGSTILSTDATGTLAWSTLANTSSIVVSAPGSYGVTQTVGGCTSASGFGIAAPLAVPAPPAVTVNNNCGNALLTATGSGLVWSTGETTAAITVSNSNNYSVTQKVGGCTSQPTVVAAAPKTLPATPVITVANFCGYTVLSTVSTESIRWTNNATTSSISTTSAGTFGVTVTGANGCTSAANPVTVTVNAIPVVPAIGGITAVTVGSTTQLSNAAPGGMWTSASTGIATVDQNGLVTGTAVGTSVITYRVTSAAGCSTSVTTLVTVAPNCVAPSFTTFPANITVAAGANCAAAVTYLAVASGSPAPSLTYDFSGATILAGLGTGSGATFNKGVTTVRISAANACGLNGTASKTFTVTVSDQTAPVFTPVADVTACAGAATYTVGTLTASDNCSAVTISYTVSGATARSGSGGNASGAFNTGVSTIVYAMKDAANNVSYDTVTVTINPIPVATFTAANNEFCSQTVINGTSSINTSGTTYKWMYGSSVVSNSAQLSLNLTNADGNYQFYATANGCTSAPVTYTYAKQNLLSSYTILVADDATLGKYNKVVAGSVGALNTKTDLRFRSYSSVTGPGSFVKGTDIRKDYGAVINNQVYGVATVTLPEMQYNTASTRYLPSYTAYSNNGALAGNFSSLTIKRNVSVTLTGNTFGTIRLEEGASVAFTANVLNIENLYVDKGVKNNTYSYVRFAPNSSVRVSTKVSIGSEVLVNPEGNKVTFYMGDQKCDNNERFTVKGGDTRVIANVIMPEGKLSVNATDSDNDDHEACDHKAHYWWNCSHRYHEHDDCDHKAHNPSTCSDDVYMTGLFIVEDLDSKGNTVIWSSFDCSAPATVVTNSKTVKQSITQEGGITKAVTTETSTEDLKVTVLPNPSTTFFTLKFESRFETPITLRVMDASGRVVDAKSKIGANSTLQVGHNYTSGTYFAEIVQGNQRRVVQLIKARG